MIVVKLMGGMGNQLFQYAAGRALAIKHGVDLCIDTSFLETDPNNQYTKRNYELDYFVSKKQICPKEIIDKIQIQRSNSLLTKIKRKKR